MPARLIRWSIENRVLVLIASLLVGDQTRAAATAEKLIGYLEKSTVKSGDQANAQIL